MNKIIRTFHPVGQGAFYSERHENFNIVYDCGTEYKNRFDKSIDRTVKTAFGENDEIDILFISHFDFDHVGKISTLKSSVKKIKKVVLPLLQAEEKVFLINFYQTLEDGSDVVRLVSNAQDFFGNETTIIHVELSDNGESPISDDLQPLDYIDDLKTNQKIKSGQGIKKNFTDYEWIYIPYNYDYKIRNSDLETELGKAGFDVDKMKMDETYTLNISIGKRKELRLIYDKLTGKINENSMVVYSGVINSTNENFRLYSLIHNLCCMDEYFHHRFWRKHIDKVSCIYTGDSNLNIVKIKSIFSRYWNSVGLVQVPHHGDIKSFNTDVLDTPKLYPISAGKNNSYGHPSDKVVIDILGNYSCPILVTEDKNSIFIQVIMR